jgi:hypothetical protein
MLELVGAHGRRPLWSPCVKSRSHNWDPKFWKSRPKSFQVSVLETASVKIQAPKLRSQVLKTMSWKPAPGSIGLKPELRQGPTNTVANHYSPRGSCAVRPESGERTSFLYIRIPFLPGRARSSICGGPKLCQTDERMDERNEFIVGARGRRPLWSPLCEIQVPKLRSHILKVFRFRSWKPRVWKSRPQSWDPKSWQELGPGTPHGGRLTGRECHSLPKPLPTYLSTHLPIEFLTYLCASFPTSQALVPTFSFRAFSLLTLPIFSLFLSKTTPEKWTVCSLPWLRTDTVANHYSPRGPRAVRPESGEGTSFLYII